MFINVKINIWGLKKEVIVLEKCIFFVFYVSYYSGGLCFVKVNVYKVFLI